MINGVAFHRPVLVHNLSFPKTHETVLFSEH